MKRRLSSVVLGIFAFLAVIVPSASRAATWEIDPVHSSVEFKVRHLMISNVKGKFEKFSGTVVSDDKDVGKSSVDVTIDASSIGTGNEKRDAHLKSPDFLDVVKYPTLIFKSKTVTPAGPGKLKMVGDLTIHGVTREVTFDVEGPSAEVKDRMGNVKVGASATAKIDRKDFGLIWNAVVESGGLVVGDEVVISIDVQFVKKSK
ncbi:MAG: YceI family protein [bacterium]|nr:YceI family protein [bacterium]